MTLLRRTEAELPREMGTFNFVVAERRVQLFRNPKRDANGTFGANSGEVSPSTGSAGFVEVSHSHLVLSGCMHKDVKPGNALLFANGVVKIGDFGICEHGIGGLASSRAGEPARAIDNRFKPRAFSAAHRQPPDNTWKVPTTSISTTKTGVAANWEFDSIFSASGTARRGTATDRKKLRA
jgi:serine/threonine protein kinase